MDGRGGVVTVSGWERGGELNREICREGIERECAIVEVITVGGNSSGLRTSEGRVIVKDVVHKCKSGLN